MNDENDQTATATSDGSGKIARPQKIYLKDVSFESPQAPEIFAQEWKPNLELEVDSHSSQIADDAYDVVLKITGTVTIDGKTAFLIEIQQAGIFVLKGFEPDGLQRLQHVYCLATLYPYASAALADLVTKGGFPSLILPPMNFAAIYNQQLLRQNKNPAEPAVTTQH